MVINNTGCWVWSEVPFTHPSEGSMRAGWSLLASLRFSVHVSWGWRYDDTTTAFSCTISTGFKTLPHVMTKSSAVSTGKGGAKMVQSFIQLWKTKPGWRMDSEWRAVVELHEAVFSLWHLGSLMAKDLQLSFILNQLLTTYKRYCKWYFNKYGTKSQARNHCDILKRCVRKLSGPRGSTVF